MLLTLDDNRDIIVGQERENKDERYEHSYNARRSEEYPDQAGNLHNSRSKGWL